MPRIARFTIDNGTYHILLRGNGKKDIFHENRDFSAFISILKKDKDACGIKIFHYVLMSNHIHLILQAEEGAGLSQYIKKITVKYVNYYRKKYGGVGHFFQDRFKSILIENGIYLLESGRYAELNPVKAGIVKEPGDYKWSSHAYYASGEYNSLISPDPEYLGLSNDSERRIELYVKFISDGADEKRSEARMFRDGVFGSKSFRESMKKEGLKPRRFLKGRPKKEEKTGE